MSDCALTSSKLSCLPLKFLFVTNFHTTPSSKLSILLTNGCRPPFSYFLMTPYGSMKYWILSGKRLGDPGACVTFHKHFILHVSPFQATRRIVSLGSVPAFSHVRNLFQTVHMSSAPTIRASVLLSPCTLMMCWFQTASSLGFTYSLNVFWSLSISLAVSNLGLSP